MDCLILKNQSQHIELAITGTFVFATQYIWILGYPRHLVYMDMPKKVFISSGVVLRLPPEMSTTLWLVCYDTFFFFFFKPGCLCIV